MDGTKNLIVVAGSKGGVGKSLTSMATVDWLTCARYESVLLVDSDHSNPDVFRQYDGEIDPTPRSLTLDSREGWLALGDLCSDHRDAHVVVNTGARNLDTMQRYSGEIMAGAAADLGRHVAVLWVIDGQRDSVELLRRYFDTVNSAAMRPPQLHVVCNEGEEEGRSFDFLITLESKWHLV